MNEHDLFRQWRDRKYGCASRQDFIEIDQFKAWQARAKIANQRIIKLESINADLYDALAQARDEIAAFPKSMGYDLTTLPVIDSALKKAQENNDE